MKQKEKQYAKDGKNHGAKYIHHPIGNGKFVEQIEKKLDIRLSVNKPGRPKKQS